MRQIGLRVSQRGRAMLPVCLVSFNSTKPRAQSFTTPAIRVIKVRCFCVCFFGYIYFGDGGTGRREILRDGMQANRKSYIHSPYHAGVA